MKVFLRLVLTLFVVSSVSLSAAPLRSEGLLSRCLAAVKKIAQTSFEKSPFNQSPKLQTFTQEDLFAYISNTQNPAPLRASAYMHLYQRESERVGLEENSAYDKIFQTRLRYILNALELDTSNWKYWERLGDFFYTDSFVSSVRRESSLENAIRAFENAEIYAERDPRAGEESLKRIKAKSLRSETRHGNSLFFSHFLSPARILVRAGDFENSSNSESSNETEDFFHPDRKLKNLDQFINNTHDALDGLEVALKEIETSSSSVLLAALGLPANVDSLSPTPEQTAYGRAIAIIQATSERVRLIAAKGRPLDAIRLTSRLMEVGLRIPSEFRGLSDGTELIGSGAASSSLEFSAILGSSPGAFQYGRQFSRSNMELLTSLSSYASSGLILQELDRIDENPHDPKWSWAYLLSMSVIMENLPDFMLKPLVRARRSHQFREAALEKLQQEFLSFEFSAGTYDQAISMISSPN